VVNLRYHIVSLVAVFLALGIGIVMGSTVIDRVTVDALNQRVNAVDRRVRGTEAENRRLSIEVQQGRDYADEALEHVLAGRLKDVPVLVLAVEGVDRKPVESLNHALGVAQADLLGTIWFTGRTRLDNAADVNTLAQSLGVAPDRPEALRRLMLSRLAGALTAGNASTSPVAVLNQTGFVGYEPPPASANSSVPALSALPPPGARVVLVSGAGADVGDDELGVPLAQLLADAHAPTVAAESGQETPGGRDVFVGLLRRDPAIVSRLSTVDDLESAMGQAATVLALQDLGTARVGQFGVGPGSQRLLPVHQ